MLHSCQIRRIANYLTYKSKLALAQRIYDAKMKRVDAAQKGKGRGSALGQLERIYKAQIELLLAKLKAPSTEAECHNDESNWLAQQCRVLRLENAKLKRSLRRQ